jgi:hypothetical protein
MHTKLGTRSFVAGALALALAFTACGDDDDDAVDATTTTEAEEEGDDLEAYCAAVAEIDDSETAPTEDQMEAIRAAAPADIETEVDTLADAFIEAIESGDFDSLFSDPELEDEFAAVEAFEAENCEGGAQGDDETGSGEVNPEFAEYCAAVAEIDQQEDFPSIDQLEELRTLAPAEISAEINTVADIMIAAIESGAGVESTFDDPAVGDAFESIDAFESENCGEEERAYGPVDPEFAEYCALSQELDSQSSFPSAEQFDELLRLVPEEIRAEAEIVIPIFVEALESGSIEAAFEDPQVEANLPALEQFDEDHCGFPDRD